MSARMSKLHGEFMRRMSGPSGWWYAPGWSGHASKERARRRRRNRIARASRKANR